MPKNKILCTAPILKFDKVVNLLKSFSDLTIIEYCKYEKLEKIIKNYDGLMPNARIKIDKNIIEKAKKLRSIYQPSLGYEHIDVDSCKKEKIHFSCLAFDTKFRKTLWSTAEHTIALMLNMLKNLNECNEDVVRYGRWDNRKYHIEDLRGKTVGIIGLGNIGSKVAMLTKAFGANIIAHDPYVISKKYKMVSLKNLCLKSDIISIHVPFNKETINLINRKNFLHMKNGTYLINTSRGGVINENDLIKALKNKIVKFTATDVLYKESVDGVSENMLVKYAKINKNIIISPHIGGSSHEYMEGIFMHAAISLKRSLIKN